MTSGRFTLSQAFTRAGWRVIDDVPPDDRPWPQGSSFYHFDKVYNRLDVGYHGPTYAYASMPDQYTYLALQRLELQSLTDARSSPRSTRSRATSRGRPSRRSSPGARSETARSSRACRSTTRVTASTEQGYGRSIDYSLRALFSFVEHYGNKNLVVIALGDHQPAHIVTGYGVNHDVPISIIAHDPKVLSRSHAWAGWPACNPAAARRSGA